MHDTLMELFMNKIWLYYLIDILLQAMVQNIVKFQITGPGKSTFCGVLKLLYSNCLI